MFEKFPSLGFLMRLVPCRLISSSFVQQYNTDAAVSILYMKPLQSFVTSQQRQALDILSLQRLIITVFLSLSLSDLCHLNICWYNHSLAAAEARINLWNVSDRTTLVFMFKRCGLFSSRGKWATAGTVWCRGRSRPMAHPSRELEEWWSEEARKKMSYMKHSGDRNTPNLWVYLFGVSSLSDCPCFRRLSSPSIFHLTHHHIIISQRNKTLVS